MGKKQSELQVNRFIETLPPQRKLVAREFMQIEGSFAEVGKANGLAYNTVKMHFHLIKKLGKTVLDRDADPASPFAIQIFEADRNGGAPINIGHTLNI